MVPIKVQCGCGQRYAFEVEPVNGQMPATVQCPVCGADGTAAANQVLSQMLPASSAPSPSPQLQMRMATAPPPPAMTAPVPPPPMTSTAPSPAREWGPGGEGDRWKWWYYVLAGVCIGGYSIWQAYNTHTYKPLGELFLAVFCIAIGIWDFQRKRRDKVRGRG